MLQQNLKTLALIQSMGKSRKYNWKWGGCDTYKLKSAFSVWNYIIAWSKKKRKPQKWNKVVQDYLTIVTDLNQKFYLDKQERLVTLFLYLTKLIYTNTKKNTSPKIIQSGTLRAQSHWLWWQCQLWWEFKSRTECMSNM